MCWNNLTATKEERNVLRGRGTGVPGASVLLDEKRGNLNSPARGNSSHNKRPFFRADKSTSNLEIILKPFMSIADCIEAKHDEPWSRGGCGGDGTGILSLTLFCLLCSIPGRVNSRW